MRLVRAMSAGVDLNRNLIGYFEITRRIRAPRIRDDNDDVDSASPTVDRTIRRIGRFPREDGWDGGGSTSYGRLTR